MSIEGVDFIPAATRLTELLPSRSETPSGDFAAWLNQELVSIDGKLAAADEALTDLATGASGNIHQVMLALEETRLAFSLMVEVRNKALEAYQELMRMQI